ncbi:Zinc finger protein [Musa troglodytarum]|uniref:Zinc finger protein n=1 Tax=Musa troglodytarum TaxID=320322 RepID=A0A9E7GUU4_9LILI|nr:Zinc finger protein [Musa troglodytarum]
MAAAVIPTTDAARQGSTTGGRPTSASSEAPGIESDQTLVAPHDDAIPAAAAAAEREDDPRCRLCGKSFRSMKSLYGHMRVHERNWRGVNPPTRDENASALPLIGTAWPGRGNRGRRGKPDLDPDDFDDEEHRAAKLLQRLSEEFRARRKQDERRNDAAPPPPPPPSSSSTCATSEMEKKMKAEDATRQYVSGTCNKAFASRHGLGGHMVSHNEGRRNSSQVLGTSEWKPKRADDAAMIDPPHGVHMKASDGEHRCELCGKVFLSGQALGGHKRAHYQQKPAAMGDTTSQASHPPYTIDLNKEPQP